MFYLVEKPQNLLLWAWQSRIQRAWYHPHGNTGKKYSPWIIHAFSPVFQRTNKGTTKQNTEKTQSDKFRLDDKMTGLSSLQGWQYEEEKGGTVYYEETPQTKAHGWILAWGGTGNSYKKYFRTTGEIKCALHRRWYDRLLLNSSDVVNVVTRNLHYWEST